MRLATVDRGKDEKASGREEGSCLALATVFFFPAVVRMTVQSAFVIGITWMNKPARAVAASCRCLPFPLPV